MQLSPLKTKHPNGFWTSFVNLDLNKVFKKRDKDWFNADRDFCVYIWRDRFKKEQYIGMGRYWDIGKYKHSKWKRSRPYSHKRDMLSKAIKCNWTCEILSWGMTSKEAHILEAYLIAKSKRKLSKVGQKKWDGVSLINKKREKKYEGLFEEYLNLDGNNNWETFGW